MAVTREEIVTAAIGLLDEVGLTGLTLRRLAERLGIQAPTLYWHIRDKRELLDLMADAIMGQAMLIWRSPAPGQPWWEWLADRARAHRAALLAHRDGALVAAGNRPGTQTLPGIEQQLQALAGAGFTPSQALLTLLTLNSYVIGEVLDLQRELDRETEHALDLTDATSSDRRATAEALLSGSYPTLLAATTEHRSADLRFEYGLGAMIAGLRSALPADGA
jgi:TetR/AcrR family tetracycline transcriptional repressor